MYACAGGLAWTSRKTWSRTSAACRPEPNQANAGNIIHIHVMTSASAEWGKQKMKTINIGDLYRSAGAFTGYGDLGRGWRFEMNAKVHNKNYRQPTIRQKNDEYAVADAEIWFEEQVFTRTEVDREGTIKIERGQER